MYYDKNTNAMTGGEICGKVERKRQRKLLRNF